MKAERLLMIGSVVGRVWTVEAHDGSSLGKKGRTWCRSDPFSPAPDDVLRFGWTDFLDVDEGVVERRAVFTDERFPVPEGARGFVHVWCDDLVEESVELSIR